MENIAKYTTSKDQSLLLRMQLVSHQLKTKKRVLVTLFIALLGGALLSFYNGSEGSLNGEPTPLLDALITWFIQFPLVTAFLYFMLWQFQRNLSYGLLKKSLASVPDSFFGDVLVSKTDDDTLLVTTPNTNMTLGKSDISKVIETPSAIHIVAEGGACLASLPFAVGDKSRAKLITQIMECIEPGDKE